MSETSDDIRNEKMQEITWNEFLAAKPPDVAWAFITDLIIEHQGGYSYHLITPDLQIYCPSKECQRLQWHMCTSKKANVPDGLSAAVVHYVCKNCEVSNHKISLLINKGDDMSEVYKFGEYPPFGPPIPQPLADVLGSALPMFEKGLRAESRSLGIGAFAYYRRVVEHIRDNLFNSILNVATTLHMDSGTIKKLSKSMDSWRFKPAVAAFENSDLIPQSLYIEGENPILLLYESLSKGVHNDDDSECLRRAVAIRTVLTDLAQRIHNAIQSDDHVKAALKVIRSGFIEAKPEAEPTPSETVETVESDDQAKGA